MSLANSSIVVTPVAGTTTPSHTVSSKHHQVVMFADANGHIRGSQPKYFYNISALNHRTTGTAPLPTFDLFNADASLIVRVFSITQFPGLATITGVVTSWSCRRTTSVGTGGTAQTVALADLSQTSLDANITCRITPTGGAALSDVLNEYTINPDESNATANKIRSKGGLEYIPSVALLKNKGTGIVLRQNQGICITQDQTDATTVGSSTWLIGFTVE